MRGVERADEIGIYVVLARRNSNCCYKYCDFEMILPRA